MRTAIVSTMLATVVLVGAACHPGPILNTGAPSVGGTISGIVRNSGGTVPLASRKVSAVNTGTGSRYEAVTNVSGGYTIKVPEGTYRLEVELHEGEAVGKQPGETSINNSDLDSGRDFEITVRAAR